MKQNIFNDPIKLFKEWLELAKDKENEIASAPFFKFFAIL